MSSRSGRIDRGGRGRGLMRGTPSVPRGGLPTTPRDRGGSRIHVDQTPSATPPSGGLISRPSTRPLQFPQPAQPVHSTGADGGVPSLTDTTLDNNASRTQVGMADLLRLQRARRNTNASTEMPSSTSDSTPKSSGVKRSMDSEATPKEVSRKRYKFDDDFTVLVGKDEVRFVIYKDVFSYRSDFFRAACSQDFKENKEKTIRMPEADPEAFRSYMQWAYGGDVVVMSPEDIASGIDPLCALQQLRPGQLYTLANFLGDIRLKNGVTDQIISLCRTISPTPGFVSHLYEHAPDNCRLLGYILDWFLWRPSPNWLEMYKTDVPSAFLADLAIKGAKANFDRRQLVNPHGRLRCHYHERDTDSNCPCDLPAPHP